jgi:hypothetical protein
LAGRAGIDEGCYAQYLTDFEDFIKEAKHKFGVITPFSAGVKMLFK